MRARGPCWCRRWRWWWWRCWWRWRWCAAAVLVAHSPCDGYALARRGRLPCCQAVSLVGGCRCVGGKGMGGWGRQEAAASASPRLLRARRDMCRPRPCVKGVPFGEQHTTARPALQSANGTAAPAPLCLTGSSHALCPCTPRAPPRWHAFACALDGTPLPASAPFFAFAICCAGRDGHQGVRQRADLLPLPRQHPVRAVRAEALFDQAPMAVHPGDFGWIAVRAPHRARAWSAYQHQGLTLLATHSLFILPCFISRTNRYAHNLRDRHYEPFPPGSVSPEGKSRTRAILHECC